MKRITGIFLSILICFTLVACQSEKNVKTDSENQTSLGDTSNNKHENKEKFDATKVMSEINSKFTFSDMTQFDDPLFLEIMYGINTDDILQFGMMINETGISADEIIIVEGVNSEATSRIFEAISNWYTAKGTQMKDYIPQEYDKITKCQVHCSGNVVYMVVLDNFSEVESIIEKYL